MGKGRDVGVAPGEEAIQRLRIHIGSRVNAYLFCPDLLRRLRLGRQRHGDFDAVGQADNVRILRKSICGRQKNAKQTEHAGGFS